MGNENEKAVDELSTSIPHDIGQTSMNESNLESHPSTAAAGKLRATMTRTTTKITMTTTMVPFSGDDAIRELPRIGTSRVPPRPTSASRHNRIGVTATTTTHATSNSVYTVVMGGSDDDVAVDVVPTTITTSGDGVICMVVNERINDNRTIKVVDAVQGGSGGENRRHRHCIKDDQTSPFLTF